jgi:hypothetical protein
LPGLPRGKVTFEHDSPSFNFGGVQSEDA